MPSEDLPDWAKSDDPKGEDLPDWARDDTISVDTRRSRTPATDAAMAQQFAIDTTPVRPLAPHGMFSWFHRDRKPAAPTAAPSTTPVPVFTPQPGMPVPSSPPPPVAAPGVVPGQDFFPLPSTSPAAPPPPPAMSVDPATGLPMAAPSGVPSPPAAAPTATPAKIARQVDPFTPPPGINPVPLPPGYDPDPGYGLPPNVSIPGTIAGTAARQALPLAAFGAAFGPGAVHGGLIATAIPGVGESGIGNAIGAFLGGIVEGTAAYVAASHIQSEVGKRVAPLSVLSPETEAAQEEAHPYAAMATQFAMMGKPNIANVYRAGRTLTQAGGRQALAAFLKDGPQALSPEGYRDVMNLLNVAQSGGLGAAYKIKDQIESGKFDPKSLATQTGLALVFNSPWSFSHNAVEAESGMRQIREAAAKAQAKIAATRQGAPDASTIGSTEKIPEHEVRTPVGETPPLRPERAPAGAQVPAAGAKPVPASPPVAAAAPEAHAPSGLTARIQAAKDKVAQFKAANPGKPIPLTLTQNVADLLKEATREEVTEETKARPPRVTVAELPHLVQQGLPEEVHRVARPEDMNELEALHNHWATLNNDLLHFRNKPFSPAALKLIDQQQEINSRMHALKKKLPGGEVGDVASVGGGPAGMGAAINGPLEGVDTTVHEAQVQTGGAARFTSRLENVTGGPVMGETGKDRAWANYNKALRVGGEFIRGSPIKKAVFDPEKEVWTLTSEEGKNYQYRAVIANTGVKFRKPDFPGGDSVQVGNGEAMLIEGKGGPVVVLGGANSAAQAALAAASEGSHVTIIARHKFDMSDYQVRQVMANPKIDKIEGDETARIEKASPEGQYGQIKTVVTKKGLRIPAQSIGGFIGGTARSDWLPEYVQRDKRGTLITNTENQVLDESGVPIPGLYAAGIIRKGAINRVLSSEADGQAAVTHAGKYIESLRQAGKLPAWKSQEKATYNRAEWGEKIPAGQTTTPPTPRETTPSLETKQPGLPAGMPTGKGVTPSTLPDTERSPSSSQPVQRPEAAPEPPAEEAPAAPTAPAEPKLVEPPPARDPTVSEKAVTPGQPMPEEQMARVTRDMFSRLTAPKTEGATANPIHTMGRSQLIDSGRAVIRQGVDPEVIVHSNQVPNEMKFAVSRAHAEDLRDIADKADQLARRKPTQVNIDNSELAFADYSNWDRETLEPLRKITEAEFPDMEAEEFDPRSYTDLRAQFIRKNKGRDPTPSEKIKLRQHATNIQDTIRDRNVLLDQHYQELERRAPELRANIKDENGLFRFVANILKDHFPCS